MRMRRPRRACRRAYRSARQCRPICGGARDITQRWVLAAGNLGIAADDGRPGCEQCPENDVRDLPHARSGPRCRAGAARRDGQPRSEASSTAACGAPAQAPAARVPRRRDQAEGARGLIDVARPARPEAALTTLQVALDEAIAGGGRFLTGLEHDQWPGHDAPVRTFSRTILEREAALSTLQVALDDAIAGGGRFVLLFGEAGIGKTSVVRAFQEAARGRVRVVSGACEALFTPRPLGPVHDIADEVGGPLLDALTAQSNRVAILGALLAELEATPTLAVLEDLHWADEATLDAISYLGRRLDTTPCVLLATFRDDQLGPRHPLRLVIGELPSRLTVRVALEPLSEAAVAELAREAGRSPLGLHAATGGNPFYVTEVLAADEDKIPETVRDAVLARAGRISSDGRRLLEAVAVIPGHVEIWLVERARAGDDLAPRRVSCIRRAARNVWRRRVPSRAGTTRGRGVAHTRSPDRAQQNGLSGHHGSAERRARPRGPRTSCGRSR